LLRGLQRRVVGAEDEQLVVIFYPVRIATALALAALLLVGASAQQRPLITEDPETIFIRDIDKQRLRGFLEQLPAEFREIVILRDLEGLSYKEIAGIADLPLGTVMSRLARARGKLQAALNALESGDAK